MKKQRLSTLMILKKNCKIKYFQNYEHDKNVKLYDPQIAFLNNHLSYDKYHLKEIELLTRAQ